MKEWITFEAAPARSGLTTGVWNVKAKDGGVLLGVIAWYRPWRKYCFEPFGGMVFEQDCLRTIAEFVERETRQRAVARKLR